MQLHIAIAIPTFNRLSYLKKNISAILAQNIKPSITLSIVIANTASSDGTDEFLVFLQNKYANVFCYNQKTKGEKELFGCLDAKKAAVNERIIEHGIGLNQLRVCQNRHERQD